MLGGVCYGGGTIATEGWLSGLKRRFAKPLYGIKACTEGSNPSPSVIGPLSGRKLFTNEMRAAFFPECRATREPPCRPPCPAIARCDPVLRHGHRLFCGVRTGEPA